MARAAGGAAKAAGGAAVRAGTQYVKSAVHDFLSGGSGEDEAIARGNKSALMARENREKAYEEELISSQVQYQEEHYAPLDSGDEFLDEVYGKLGDIDNKLGKMLSHFVAADKREEDKEKKKKHASLTRKTTDKGGSEGSTGSTSTPSVPSEGGESSGGGGGGGGSDGGFWESALGLGGQSLSEYLIRKGLNKIPKPSPGTLGKFGNAARVGGKALGLAAFAANAGMEAYDMYHARGNLENEYGNYNYSMFDGMRRQLASGYQFDIGNLAKGSAFDNFGFNQALKGQYASGIGSILTGGGFKLGELIGGASMDEALRRESLERLGLTENDYKRGKTILTSGVGALVDELRSYGIIDESALEEAVQNAYKAALAIDSGLGAENAPETWPVTWSSKDSRYIMEDANTSGTGIRSALYQASLEAVSKAIEESKQFDPKNTKELDEKGDDLKKKKQKYIDTNKLHISMKRSFSATDNKELLNTVFTLYGNKDVRARWKEILNKYDFGKLYESSYNDYYIYNKEGPYYNKIKREGLYVNEPSAAGGWYKRFLINPGEEPKYLADGGLLNGATNIGYAEADAISSLEKSGAQIRETIIEGFQNMENDNWFDDSVMNYLMDSVLPGLVGALKKEDKSQGIITEVSVFG